MRLLKRLTIFTKVLAAPLLVIVMLGAVGTFTISSLAMW